MLHLHTLQHKVIVNPPTMQVSGTGGASPRLIFTPLGGLGAACSFAARKADLREGDRRHKWPLASSFFLFFAKRSRGCGVRFHLVRCWASACRRI